MSPRRRSRVATLQAPGQRERRLPVLTAPAGVGLRVAQGAIGISTNPRQWTSRSPRYPLPPIMPASLITVAHYMTFAPLPWTWSARYNENAVWFAPRGPCDANLQAPGRRSAPVSAHRAGRGSVRGASSIPTDSVISPHISFRAYVFPIAAPLRIGATGFRLDRPSGTFSTPLPAGSFEGGSGARFSSSSTRVTLPPPRRPRSARGPQWSREPTGPTARLAIRQ